MFPHMLCDSVNIFEETDMTELIYLVMTDGLDLQLFLDIL